MDNPVVGASPLLVMVITRGWPDGLPFKVRPLILSAKFVVLALKFCITVMAKLSALLGLKHSLRLGVPFELV